MASSQTIEVPILGMDCAECTEHVRGAIAALPGVQAVEVFLAAAKAVVRLDPAAVGLPAIARAVEGVGYSIAPAARDDPGDGGAFYRQVATLLALVIGAVLSIAVVGEGFGVFGRFSDRVPWPVWLAIVVVGGYPVFRNVVRATLRRQIIAHTLMTMGVLAALLVGEWATAAVVVFLMRVGDFTERFTTERARRAVRDLTALAPQQARVVRGEEETLVPVEQVRPGDLVVVRPGDKIPVDGRVVAGQATIDQATITGESMPVEAGPGSRVFAATLARLGSLRVEATHVGRDTTFGRVVRLVEEAEVSKAGVQRWADRFSAVYLPIVAGIAALTLLVSRNPLATAAVLVVACSCSFALATPIAMLASIGAAAQRGLLIKGGRYLEALERADVLLIDKTGTLTTGRPRLTDVVPLDGHNADEILASAASAERYSEHPLAEAVRLAALERGLSLRPPEGFEASPGQGVRCTVDGRDIAVGNARWIGVVAAPSQATLLESQGKTLLYVAVDGRPAGLLAAADTPRPEARESIIALRTLGFSRIELLTGDLDRTAAELARELGVAYRAELMPEDKIAVVREYQAAGHKTVMVGDGVNDAPALAQADVGIAMGAAGSGVALEAAHVALMRDDWRLIPEVVRIARRTMRVVRLNFAFTAVYNVAGLSLAAFGLLPPILAAAAQSLPDLGILANSSRLLRQR